MSLYNKIKQIISNVTCTVFTPWDIGCKIKENDNNYDFLKYPIVMGILIFSLFIIGCTSSLKLHEGIDRINICPKIIEQKKQEIHTDTLLKIFDKLSEKLDVINCVDCDDTTLPTLSIIIKKVSIDGIPKSFLYTVIDLAVIVTAVTITVKTEHPAFMLIGSGLLFPNSNIKYEYEIDSCAIKELKGKRNRRVDQSGFFSKKDKNRKALLKKFYSQLKKDIKKMFYKKPVVKIQSTHRRR